MKTRGRPPVAIVQYVDAPYPSNVSEVMGLDDPGDGTTDSVCFLHPGTDHYDIAFPASPGDTHDLNAGCPGDWFTRHGLYVAVTHERPNLAPLGRPATGLRACWERALIRLHVAALSALASSAMTRDDRHELAHIRALLIHGDTSHTYSGDVCLPARDEANASSGA